MSHRFCRVETDGRIQFVVLNRPEQLNALHKEAHHELGEVFDEFERDPRRWVAIVTGAGDAFCVGADLKSGPLDFDFVPRTGFAGLTHRFNRKKPIIAAVNGLALGGGFEMALACDIILAAEEARFGLTEARVGLYPAAGGIQRMIREIGPKRAHGLLLTGKQVSAEHAGELGFVNQVTSASKLLDLARQWAEEILKCSPVAIAAIKAIADGVEADVRTSIEAMMDLPAVKAVARSGDLREGALAFSERRAPRWADPPSQ